MGRQGTRTGASGGLILPPGRRCSARHTQQYRWMSRTAHAVRTLTSPTVPSLPLCQRIVAFPWAWLLSPSAPRRRGQMPCLPVKRTAVPFSNSLSLPPISSKCSSDRKRSYWRFHDAGLAHRANGHPASGNAPDSKTRAMRHRRSIADRVFCVRWRRQELATLATHWPFRLLSDWPAARIGSSLRKRAAPRCLESPVAPERRCGAWSSPAPETQGRRHGPIWQKRSTEPQPPLRPEMLDRRHFANFPQISHRFRQGLTQHDATILRSRRCGSDSQRIPE